MKITLAAFALVSLVSVQSFAAGQFDGEWTVSITPTVAGCPSNSWPVDISDGKVVSVAGMSGVSTGGISQTGKVQIDLSAGVGSMSAYGAAKGALASGKWTADGGRCRGNWSAARQR